MIDVHFARSLRVPAVNSLKFFILPNNLLNIIMIIVFINNLINDLKRWKKVLTVSSLRTKALKVPKSLGVYWSEFTSVISYPVWLVDDCSHANQCKKILIKKQQKNTLPLNFYSTHYLAMNYNKPLREVIRIITRMIKVFSITIQIDISQMLIAGASVKFSEIKKIKFPLFSHFYHLHSLNFKNEMITYLE